MTRLLAAAGLVFVFSAPAAAEDPRAFTGAWAGYGYQCYDDDGALVGIARETFRVTLEDGQLVATKVDGDACVTSGAVSWIAEVGDDVALGAVYPTRMRVGSPWSPNSGWVPGAARFVSEGRIEMVTHASGRELVFERDEDPVS